MNKRLIEKNKPAMGEDGIRALKSCEIEKLIRLRYSVSDELSILRQRDDKPEEFAAYHEYAEECKHVIKEKLGEV